MGGIVERCVVGWGEFPHATYDPYEPHEPYDPSYLYGSSPANRHPVDKEHHDGSED